jgi:hypothetical protein
MASKDLIDLGIAPDSGTGDSARRGGAKINTLFADIYTHLGDNPVGNDPTGPNYGYRQKFGEYEYKVGEIHAAGRYIPIKFKTTGTLSYDPTFGWGVDGTGTVTTTGGIPDVYLDSEWFFLSRGDSVGLDLREVDSDKAVHLVLPLAVPGDVIKLRDVFNSWSGRIVNLWTTPYEFQNATQVTEWETATGFVCPDSDSISINYLNNLTYSVPYKAVTSFDGVTYPSLTQKFSSSSDSDLPVGCSPVYAKDRGLYEIVLTYIGARYGWVAQLNSLQTVDIAQQFAYITSGVASLINNLNIARSDLDSDSIALQILSTNADSDARDIAQLRREADSDSNQIQLLLAAIDGGTY